MCQDYQKKNLAYLFFTALFLAFVFTFVDFMDHGSFHSDYHANRVYEGEGALCWW